MQNLASRSPALLVVAVLATLAAYGLLVPLRWVDATLVVVAVAATGQRMTGALAALAGAVWFDLLLTVPYGRFTITNPDDVETALLLTVAGLAVTEIALWGGGNSRGRADRGVGRVVGAGADRAGRRADPPTSSTATPAASTPIPRTTAPSSTATAG
jgi:Domain of unknown function (DUF4118)